MNETSSLAFTCKKIYNTHKERATVLFTKGKSLLLLVSRCRSNLKLVKHGNQGNRIISAAHLQPCVIFANTYLSPNLFSFFCFIKKSLLSADWDRASTLPHLDPHVAWNAHAQAQVPLLSPLRKGMETK